MKMPMHIAISAPSIHADLVEGGQHDDGVQQVPAPLAVLQRHKGPALRQAPQDELEREEAREDIAHEADPQSPASQPLDKPCLKHV